MRTKPEHKIALEGYPFAAIAAFLTLAGFLVNFYAGLFFLVLLGFVFYFFRNPARTTPLDDSLVVSPADGRIVGICEMDENRILNKRCKRISIFLSPLNVHVNRVPVSGTVTNVVYNKGKFMAAFEEKASLENEQNAVVVENKRHGSVLFVQIAGWIARRIVCYAKVGENWKAGDIFGLIRFGSRMDVYLTVKHEIVVVVGDKVKSGETILAKV